MDLFRSHFHHLPPHLSTGKPRITVDSSASPTSRSTFNAGSSLRTVAASMRNCHGYRFTFTDSMKQQVLDVPREGLPVMDRSTLDRRFQSERKGKSSGREETIHEAETLDQRKRVHWPLSAK